MGIKVNLHGSGRSLSFYCPGCERPHSINYAGRSPVWGWNQSQTAPTFSPSVNCSGTEPSDDPEKFDDPKHDVPYRCHTWVTDGRIQFLDDCTHKLAGQTVELPDWPEDPYAHL